MHVTDTFPLCTSKCDIRAASGPVWLTEMSRRGMPYKAEECLIMDRPLPILVTIESICFDHDCVLSRVTPSSLVSSTCSIATLLNKISKLGFALSK